MNDSWCGRDVSVAKSNSVIVSGLQTNGAEAGLKESGADDGEQPVPLSAGGAMSCKEVAAAAERECAGMCARG